MRRYGKYFVSSTKKYFEKRVDNLMQQKGFAESSGRKYQNVPNYKKSALHDMKMADLCKWINKHKYEIKIVRKAR